MNNPTVGILVANYNYGPFLKECLESAINQNYLDIRIAVIDDNSNDGSQKIIEEYAEKDFRIIPTYLTEGKGPAFARNLGIKALWDTCEFFQCLDSDDIMLPNKTRELLQKIMVSEQISVSYGDYDIKSEITGVITREFKESYDLRVLHNHCLVHSAFMIRRSTLDKIKEVDENGEIQFYDKNLHGSASPGSEYLGSCEDYDLLLRASEHGIMVHCPKILSIIRTHKNNASNIDKVNKVWAKNVEYMQKKALARQGKI